MSLAFQRLLGQRRMLRLDTKGQPIETVLIPLKAICLQGRRPNSAADNTPSKIACFAFKSLMDISDGWVLDDWTG